MKSSVLYIKTIDKDGNVVPFPLKNLPATLTEYTYSATRMGGAPSLSGTVTYPWCLDNFWTHKEFVEYNGERFIVEQIPTSSKDNETCMYKHSLDLRSARFILDNILFFDAVKNDAGDVYRSNMTSFTFGGDITEFVSRINSSLDFCGIYDENGKDGYCVVIDEGIDDTEVQELSFEDKYISEVLQEIHDTYELAYYWKGRVCHVGWTENTLSRVVKYGQDEGLLSVQKENQSQAIVDMITGHGSSDNLDYYYPNDDEFGTPIYTTQNVDSWKVESIDLQKVFPWCSYDDVISLCKYDNDSYSAVLTTNVSYLMKEGGAALTVKPTDFPTDVETTIVGNDVSAYIGRVGWKDSRGTAAVRTSKIIIKSAFEVTGHKVEGEVDFSTFSYDVSVKKSYKQSSDFATTAEEVSPLDYGLTCDYVVYVCEGTTVKDIDKLWNGTDGDSSFRGERPLDVPTDAKEYKISDSYPFISNSVHTIVVICTITATKNNDDNVFSLIEAKLKNGLTYNLTPKAQYYFSTDKGTTKAYSDSGISLLEIDTIPAQTGSYEFDSGKWKEKSISGSDDAAKITITGRKWIAPSQYLMPSVYRETDGAERFLYALDDTHLLPDSTSEYYTFTNKYIKGNPHQSSVSFEDIKPTIKGMTNASGELLGEVLDVAYDINDSDTLEDDGETYTHQYFYIKLHKFDGEYGFDLFKHALASESMKLEMIDCQGCPACTFPIRCVTTDNSTFYNCVSTDKNGNLVAVGDGEKDDYILSTSGSISDTYNQDTTAKEVWICVQKDNSTLGQIMPNAAANLRVKKGDKFVITGCALPQSYVRAAEKRLDAALVANMKENNDEKFSFTVKFSRIFLAINKEFAAKLNENARLTVEYNNTQHPLYVNSYTVKSDGNILEEVSVELVDDLKTSTSSSLQRIDAIKGDVINSVSQLISNSNKGNVKDTLAKMNTYFLRRDTDDTAEGVITFQKGLVSLLSAWLQGGFSVGASKLFGMDSAGNLNANGIKISDTLTLGEYISGIAGGSGGRIDASGNAELASLTLRQFLEVPELRYNRVSINVGNDWRAPGGGIIESVEIDYDDNGNEKMTGTITLHLEDGEIGEVAVDDICQGIWHNYKDTSLNETSSTDDSKGNFTFAGFSTCYFCVTEITNIKNNSTFKYLLRDTAGTWKKTNHPQAGMHFVCYGNFNNTDRQSSRYSTLTYERFLKNVTTWEFSASNLAAQFGDLSNLKVHGLEMTGYSAYLNNIYMTGTIQQFENLEPEMKITDDMGGFLAFGESTTVTCKVMKGFDDVTSEAETWTITRNSGDPTNDEAWNNSEKAKAFKGSILICLTAKVNDLGTNADCLSTLFTVTATSSKWGNVDGVITI